MRVETYIAQDGGEYRPIGDFTEEERRSLGRKLHRKALGAVGLEEEKEVGANQTNSEEP